MIYSLRMNHIPKWFIAYYDSDDIQSSESFFLGTSELVLSRSSIFYNMEMKKGERCMAIQASLLTEVNFKMKRIRFLSGKFKTVIKEKNQIIKKSFQMRSGKKIRLQNTQKEEVKYLVTLFWLTRLRIGSEGISEIWMIF